MTIKKLLPDFELHASTQMVAHSLDDVNYLESKGFDRVVLARELNIDEIKYICDNTNVDIEVFVHGGMCMSYSGRKLFTSYIATRDINLYSEDKKYYLVEEKRPGQYCPIYEDEGGTFFYASKDLCMIEFLPELIKSGVTTLSIEGNMKSDEYMEKALKIYRKAIDKFIENPEKWQLNKVWLEELQSLDHRVLTTGFYLEENIDYTK